MKTPDRVSVSPKPLEHLFDTLEAQLKIGGAGAGHTCDSPPNHCKGVAMTRVSEEKCDSRKNIAIEYLHLSREHYERSKNLRLHYVRAAQAEGVSNVQIGEILGITEAAVRKLIERAA